MRAPARRPDAPALARFARAYAEHRAQEGRALDAGQLRALPWLETGPVAWQWAVRARTFERFLDVVLAPAARRLAPAPLRVLDVGAGNGWLSYRVALDGHHALALDLRTDEVDGLGAAAGYAPVLSELFPRVAASFDALPVEDGSYDLVVFNASLHYALDLGRVLDEAARALAADGTVAILDSPFYQRDADGAAMVAEKRASAAERFGTHADALTALRFVEYLTRTRLADASRTNGLRWRRHRVLYPLRYELRAVRARVRGRRRPSRFDLWVGMRPGSPRP